MVLRSNKKTSSQSISSFSHLKQLNEKSLSRGEAETTLERSDDGPKGEVFIKINKKPHKSGGVTLNNHPEQA